MAITVTQSVTTVIDSVMAITVTQSVSTVIDWVTAVAFKLELYSGQKRKSIFAVPVCKTEVEVSEFRPILWKLCDRELCDCD